MHNIHQRAPLATSISADTTLWLAVCLAGLFAAALLWTVSMLLMSPRLVQAGQDALALGFTIPAAVTCGIWWRDLRAPAAASIDTNSSQAAQLSVAGWLTVAIALGSAQAYVGKAWLVGSWPPALCIPMGAAALSPLAAWRLCPHWLRKERHQ